MNSIALKMLDRRPRQIHRHHHGTHLRLAADHPAGGDLRRPDGAHLSARSTDLRLPDIWVMDTKVQFIDDVKPLQDTQLSRVRGVEGVEWAVPLYKGLLKARLDNGNFQTCNVIGLDDATLIGGPPVMVKGKLADLRRADSVIVDEYRRSRQARAHGCRTARPVPLDVGDTMELNDHRAVVVGICREHAHVPVAAGRLHDLHRATSSPRRSASCCPSCWSRLEPGGRHRRCATGIAPHTGLAAYTRSRLQEAHL